MLGFSRKSPDHAAAADRVRDWTRVHFKLTDETTVMVSEVACTLPGCTPLETVIAFWTENTRRHHFKVFKPVDEVILDDFPPSWMKNALADIEGVGCACC